MSERYRLAQDNDSHWYVIPVSRQQEWDNWTELDPEDARAWNVPAFAQRVGGSYSLVTFSEPEIA